MTIDLVAKDLLGMTCGLVVRELVTKAIDFLLFNQLVGGLF